MSLIPTALDSESISSGSYSSRGKSTPSNSLTGSNSEFDGSSKTGDGLRLGKAETENVNGLRYVVLAILLAAAVGISVLVYLVTRRADVDEMETQFESTAVRLIEAFEAIRTERIATLASMTVAAIAHGVDHSRDWPFVSLSSFQQRSFATKENSGALQIILAPFVGQADRNLWEEYVVSDEADVDWIEQARDYQEARDVAKFIPDYGTSFRALGRRTYSIQASDGQVNSDAADSPKQEYMPIWEMSPFLHYEDVNIDLYQEGDNRGIYGNLALQEAAIVIGDMFYAPAGGSGSDHKVTSDVSQLLSIEAKENVEYKGDPMTYVFVPVFDSFQGTRKPVSVLIGLFNWGTLFRGSLEDADGIDIVLRNTCAEPFTYRVKKGAVVPLGRGDLHESGDDTLEETTGSLEDGRVADGTKFGLGFVDRGCSFFATIHSSEEFEQSFRTPVPAILCSSVAAVFIFAIMMFFVYDHLVERRQAFVLKKAVQSTAIVSSLFPTNVRDRLLESSNQANSNNGGGTGVRDKARGKKNISASTVPPIDGMEDDDEGPPIADLFPNCTVMFADIAGFTAWSSTRDPAQVFTLLQNLYKAFDRIAARRKVFKVETIGDSYVAVTGLPEPQADHAVIMAKFARDCIIKMHEVTRALEIRLGPDTNDLSLRIGLNSGQVTGGVLRGDRARFQLFGDTVNTASRMESTGKRDCIQISQSTADILITAGKEQWITARSDQVTAKGKGTLQTYWLDIDGHRASSNREENPARPSSFNNGTSSIALNKQSRSISWMAEVLQDYVKKIVAKNTAAGIFAPRGQSIQFQSKPGSICMDELVERFDLTVDSSSNAVVPADYRTMELDTTVIEQLHKYVEMIASKYQSNNPFHNFDHACHVTMSVHKLMKRVVGDGGSSDDWGVGNDDDPQDTRLVTYGVLTSDPLTLFAIVFSGLIHDVDHRGVSNMQLATEEPKMAEHYRKQAIAEQNSFDISWDLLMSKDFEALRRVIFPTRNALLRFRQVVINTVLATDIFDKKMGDMRKERWHRAFGDGALQDQDANIQVTRATIVLEHIIQASDVSHTMQHWHVYTKWNKRLFLEMRQAYKEGRMGKDPATFWYEGELSFFDNYVIPLAKKLEECQVFGVSSSEYLNYAQSNRTEWESKGKAVLAELLKASADSESNELV